MIVAVIGLGKIGLPLAVQYAKKGKRVYGVDTNEETVKRVNQGLEPFPGEENLSIFLKEVVEEGRLSATSSYEEAIGLAEVVVIATPLLINGLNQPDFSILDSVSQSIGLNIRKGSLVILETTVPIGTTRDRLAKIIEKNSSFEAGKDFFVTFSPERVFTGRIFEDLKRYPKLVGGISEDSALRAKEFYEDVLDFDERMDLTRKNGVWLMQSAEAAEFSKLAETTYRDVNIALANQFAKHASHSNLDINEIIEASNSQPYSHIHKPGIWVGGHCIPVYPHLYLYGDPKASLVSIARDENVKMADYYVSKLENYLHSLTNKNIVILGISYRPGVKEHANSGAYYLNKLLLERGASVFAMDPLYDNNETESLGFVPFDSTKNGYVGILLTEHNIFLQKEFFQKNRLKSVLDGRNCLEGVDTGSTRVISI